MSRGGHKRATVRPVLAVISRSNISLCHSYRERFRNFSFVDLLLHCFTILPSLYNCWESNVLGLLFALSVISRSYKTPIGCFRCIELVRLLVTTGTCGAIDWGVSLLLVITVYPVFGFQTICENKKGANDPISTLFLKRCSHRLLLAMTHEMTLMAQCHYGC